MTGLKKLSSIFSGSVTLAAFVLADKWLVPRLPNNAALLNPEPKKEEISTSLEQAVMHPAIVSWLANSNHY